MTTQPLSALTMLLSRHTKRRAFMTLLGGAAAAWPLAFAAGAAEFVRLKVDVIVVSGTPAVMASKRATSTIPIVFATAGDPVGNHLVDSLARPGGNVTGLSVQSNELAGKRIELLRKVVPGLRRLAILG